MNPVGIVIIGRNEGERLRRCLSSAQGSACTVIYVDSGSTDGSVEVAKAMGADAVALDMSRPFTAARGRNAGFARLLELYPKGGYVQFVDGDCELVTGWLERAVEELERREDVAALCGRLRERHPEQSIYNRLCQLEWDAPAGEVRACGGIAMHRVPALRDVGGFDPTVAAGEEPELCHRLRQRGWKILRVDTEMALHDAAMTRFGQWWKRQVRGGRGAMDLVARLGFADDPHYSGMVRSSRIWAIGWPMALALVIVASWAFGGVALAAVAGLAFALTLPAQMFRLALKTRRRGVEWPTALACGVFTVIGKWPAMIGQIRYWRDCRRGRQISLIEYKQASASGQL